MCEVVSHHSFSFPLLLMMLSTFSRAYFPFVRPFSSVGSNHLSTFKNWASVFLLWVFENYLYSLDINPLFFFSRLISLARTFSRMLNRSSESGHPCLFPNLREKTLDISLLYMMLAVGFS